MKSGKKWGETRLLLETPLFAVHELRILPNARCSMHVHEHKWNGFYVVSGELFVDVEKRSYALQDETVLQPGEFTTVPPGEYHQFRTGDQPVVALEFYYLGALTEDIIRRNVGTVGVPQ